MSSIISLLFDIGMATGPILGYVYQYRLIKLTEQVGSFSIDICGILIFANVLRLNFYLFKQFETALLFQSLFMITMQIFLLHLCAKFNPKKVQINMAGENQQSVPNLEQQEISIGLKMNPQLFWRWQTFKPFGVTIMLLVMVSFLVSIIFKFGLNFSLYGQLVGLIALISESVLILPQIIKNVRMGTTKGLSYMLVFLNLTGDILKLIYFFVKSQPFQFILCGIIQVCLDSFVVGQIIYFRAKQKKALRQGSKTLTPIKRNRWVHEQYQQEITNDIQDSQTRMQLKQQISDPVFTKKISQQYIQQDLDDFDAESISEEDDSDQEDSRKQKKLDHIKIGLSKTKEQRQGQLHSNETLQQFGRLQIQQDNNESNKENEMETPVVVEQKLESIEQK